MAGSDSADLVVRVAANIEKLQTDMAAAAGSIKTIETATTEAGHAAEGFSASLNDLGHHFVERVAEGELLKEAIEKILEAAKEAILAFPELVEHTIEVGNSLFEMALKTGSSVEGLSALRYVASQTGIDFASFGSTMSMLEKNLGATGEAGAKVSATLKSMGLDLATLKNERTDEAFIAVAQALFEVKNNADKAHDAAVLMGKGAKEMAGLWHEDIGDMIKEATDLGLVMSTETAAGAHLAEIGFKGLQMRLEGVGMQIANAFLPAIIGIEDDLGHGLTEAVKTLNSSLGTLGGDGGFLGIVARAMGKGDEATKAQIELYDYLKAALIGVVRNGLEPMVTAVSYGMVGWDATKVIVGDVVQVVNYLALAYEKSELAFERFHAAISFGAESQMWKDEIINTQGVIDGLNREITARAAQVAADKKSEGEWMTWSTQANAAIEVALTAVGNAHTDVGHKIKEMADVSRAAYGRTSENAEENSAKMIAAAKHLAEELNKIEHEKNAVSLTELDKWGASQMAASQKHFEAESKGLDEIGKAQLKLHDLTMKSTLDSTSYQITKVWETADADVKAFKGSTEQRQQYSDVRMKVAAIEANAIEYSADTAIDKVKAHADDVIKKAVVTAQAAIYSMNSSLSLDPNGDLSAQAAARGGTVAFDSYGNPYVKMPGAKNASDDGSRVGGMNSGGITLQGNQQGIGSGRASGGPVNAGSTYTVGERGPETLVMGAQSGAIIPNGGGGGGIVTHIYITQPLGTPDQIARVVGDAVMQQVMAGRKFPSA